VVPENLRFGGGVTDTVLNPGVAVILILTGLLMCLLPQKKAIIPFLLTSFLIPADQVLVVTGLHFPLVRVLILFGMLRIFLIKGRGEWKIFSGGLNKIDIAFILLSSTSAVAGILLFQNTQAVIFQLGQAFTAFGTYFLLRCLIREQEDVIRVIRLLALVVVAVGGVMVCEQLMKGWNPYVVLGGVRAGTDMDRNGSIRAVGSFAQPILAGTFGAVVLPLFFALWVREKKYRLIASIGIFGAITMIIACNSSTALFGFVAGTLGFCMWPLRRTTRLIRWGIVITLVSLHLTMKAPVWHLITRFDISGSSYHRYQLIDQCIGHFWDWWLIGTSANATWGWDMWDTANQYVEVCYRSGLLGLLLFLAMIVYGFKYLGRAREAATDNEQALFFWALGAALLAQATSFFGISLWDQSIVGWYALLAFIGAVAAPQKLDAAVRQVEPGSKLAREGVTFEPANELVMPWR
jgi:hypothetical protein